MWINLAKGRYDRILGRYILKYLGLNLSFSDHIIEAYNGCFKGYIAPMIDLCTYEFEDLNTGKFIPEESFSTDYRESNYE